MPAAAPKPGVIPLRPLGLGELLDGAVSYIRQNPRPVLGWAAVLSVISALVQFFVLLATLQSVQSAASGASSDVFGDVAGDALLGTTLASNAASVVSLVVSVVVQIIATGIFTILIGGAVLGVRFGGGEAWRRTKPFLWRLVGLTLLTTLATLALLVGGIVLGVLLGLALGPVGILVGVLVGLAGLAAFVWLTIALLLAPPALVLERLPVLASWRRSLALARGSWWRLFGIWLLTQVIASLVASVLVVPLALVGSVASVAVGDPEALPWPLLVTTALGQLVAGIVTLPFVAGVTALLYVDRRIRREALDLRLAHPVPGDLGGTAASGDVLDAYLEPGPPTPAAGGSPPGPYPPGPYPPGPYPPGPYPPGPYPPAGPTPPGPYPPGRW
ncbi:MAG: hypothetical protein R2737_12825 [Candidatus Nanopelagicales bacterium]